MFNWEDCVGLKCGKIVRSCCVIGCNSKSHDRTGHKLNSGVRFFSFPCLKKGHGQLVVDVTKRRRMAWVGTMFLFYCVRYWFV